MTRTANRREHRKCSHVAGEKYSSSFQNVRLRRFARFVVDVRHALEPRLLQRNHFHLWIFFSRFFQDLLGDFSRGHRWSGPERRRGRFRVRVASFKSTFATTAAAALRGADDFRPSFFGRRRSRRCYPFLVRRRRRRSEGGGGGGGHASHDRRTRTRRRGRRHRRSSQRKADGRHYCAYF